MSRSFEPTGFALRNGGGGMSGNATSSWDVKHREDSTTSKLVHELDAVSYLFIVHFSPPLPCRPPAPDRGARR